MPLKIGTPDRGLASACRILLLLSDPQRLQMLMMLAEEGECDVLTVYKRLKISQPLTSINLRYMRMEHLLLNHRRGKQMLYSLDPTACSATPTMLKILTPPYGITLELFKCECPIDTPTPHR